MTKQVNFLLISVRVGYIIKHNIFGGIMRYKRHLQPFLIIIFLIFDYSSMIMRLIIEQPVCQLLYDFSDKRPL